MKKCKVKIYVNPLANLFNPPIGGLPSLSEVFEDFVINNPNMKFDESETYQRFYRRECKEMCKPITITVSCEAYAIFQKIPQKYRPEFFYLFNSIALEHYVNQLLGGLLR